MPNKYLVTAASLVSIFLPFFVLLPFLDDIHPLVSGAIVCGYMMVTAYIKYHVFDNLGVVDEMWSTAPWIYAYVLNNWTIRGYVMQVLISLWAVRLSYNLWRKGGYYGLEDYRWRDIKNNTPNPCKWFIFHVFFWTIYQNVLNAWMTLPIYYIDDSEFEIRDYFFSIMMFTFIVIEAVADQQQWNFQNAKKKALAEGSTDPVYTTGFLRSGLFKYSRHPNFFGEQGFWVTWYLFSWSLNWGLAGTLQLLTVFVMSLIKTETLSKKKYPLFKEYIRTTSALVLWCPRKWSEENARVIAQEAQAQAEPKVDQSAVPQEKV